MMNTDTILIKRFLLNHGQKAAKSLEDIDPSRLADFFTSSPNEWLLEVISHMNPQRMSEVFEKMKQEKLVSLLESMDLSHAVSSLRMMEQDLAEALQNKLSVEKATSVKKLLTYPDDSVGAFMDVQIFTLTDNLTAKEALASLKRHKVEIPPQLFVTGEGRKLSGAITLSDLVQGDSAGVIRSLMKTSLPTLSPETPAQSVLGHPGWQDYYALPVLDRSAVFLGAIRLETIRSLLFQTGNKGEDEGQMAIAALGELYHLGLAGLLRSATDLRSPSNE